MAWARVGVGVGEFCVEEGSCSQEEVLSGRDINGSSFEWPDTNVGMDGIGVVDNRNLSQDRV